MSEVSSTTQDMIQMFEAFIKALGEAALRREELWRRLEAMQRQNNFMAMAQGMINNGGPSFVNFEANEVSKAFYIKQLFDKYNEEHGLTPDDNDYKFFIVDQDDDGKVTFLCSKRDLNFLHECEKSYEISRGGDTLEVSLEDIAKKSITEDTISLSIDIPIEEYELLVHRNRTMGEDFAIASAPILGDTEHMRVFLTDDAFAKIGPRASEKDFLATLTAIKTELKTDPKLAEIVNYERSLVSDFMDRKDETPFVITSATNSRHYIIGDENGFEVKSFVKNGDKLEQNKNDLYARKYNRPELPIAPSENATIEELKAYELELKAYEDALIEYYAAYQEVLMTIPNPVNVTERMVVANLCQKGIDDNSINAVLSDTNSLVKAMEGIAIEQQVNAPTTLKTLDDSGNYIDCRPLPETDIAKLQENSEISKVVNAVIQETEERIYTVERDMAIDNYIAALKESCKKQDLSSKDIADVFGDLDGLKKSLEAEWMQYELNAKTSKSKIKVFKPHLDSQLAFVEENKKEAFEKAFKEVEYYVDKEKFNLSPQAKADLYKQEYKTVKQDVIAKSYNNVSKEFAAVVSSVSKDVPWDAVDQSFEQTISVTAVEPSQVYSTVQEIPLAERMEIENMTVEEAIAKGEEIELALSSVRSDIISQARTQSDNDPTSNMYKDNKIGSAIDDEERETEDREIGE